MCGKYILAQAAKAERAMGIRRGRWEYPLSYRVLPTEQVPVVVDESGDPEAAMMRWGLIPWWAYGGALPEARRALTSFPDERMQAWRVSHRVNSPKLPNDASLIEPQEAPR